MKKSLLLLVSLLVSVASFAQWTKPVPKATDTFKYSERKGDNAGDTVVYYLYNKDAGAFLNQGNAWGTQATIANKGLKVMVSKYLPTAEGDEAVAEWDGKTILIADSCESKKNWFDLVITVDQGAITGCYVDHGSQADYMFELESVGNGVYKIFAADVNPVANTASQNYKPYLGVSGNTQEANGTVIDANIDSSEDAGAWINWQFISEADYEAYLPLIEQYDAAMALQAKIEEVKANPDYASISTADAEKVLANTNSTTEALKAATNKLAAGIKNIEFGGATEDNPMDATKFLLNPNFDSDASGWTNTFEGGKTGTNIGHQGAKYDNGEVHIQAFIEAWANSAFSTAISSRALGVGQISQTVADMPQGKYKFTVDAISNNQDGKEVHGVELFATGGDLNVFKKVVTGNGLPEHFEITFVNDGDEITMGVRTTEECTANWIALDNFTLTYYGPTTKSPEELGLEAAIAAAEEAYPEESFEEVIANKADKDAFAAAVEAGKAATGDFAAATEAIETAQKALDASKKSYAAYVAQVEKVRDLIANADLQGDKADLISDYCMEGNETEPDEENPYGSADYILVNLEPTAAQIEEETARIEKLSKEAFAESLVEGMDCTFLLTNANFTEGNSTGWTVNVNPTNFAWTGGLLNVPVCESWHSYFDISQEVEAPAGVYSISLNGFCRLDDGVDSEVPAEVYLNNFATRLQNLNGAPIPAEEAVDGVNAYLTNGAAGAWTQNPIFQDKEGNPCKRQSPADNTDSEVDGGYVPNGMEGASVAFSAGRYQAVAYGLCEGGKLTIGVRNRLSTHVWALWGNFKLTYMGKNLEALQSILPTFVEQLSSYEEENVNDLTNPMIKTIDDAIAKGNSASDADDMYDALIEVNSALIDAKANKEAVEAFKVEEEALNAVCEEYPDADQSPAEALADAIAGYAELTTPELESLTVKMQDAEKAIIFGSASEDSPADITKLFIVNPDFNEGNINGWTDTFTAGNHGFQNNATYGEGVIDQFMEAWRQTTADNPATLDDGSLSQEITLPVGSYVLSADIIAKNQLNDTAEEKAPVTGMYLFAGETRVEVDADSEEPARIEIPFVMEEAGTIAIGVVTESATGNWLVADNFKLECKGADITAIKTVTSSSSANGIYTVSGARVSTLQKGINIVNTNGVVRKVLVK